VADPLTIGKLTRRAGAMIPVVSLEALRRSDVASLFEGDRHGDVALSLFVTTWPPRGGPDLHTHPYPEVFLVQEGRAAFTVGDDELEVGGGHMLVVPAEAPHRFHNSGEEPLQLISVHPSGHVVQRDLPARAPDARPARGALEPRPEHKEAP
jgi:mannose-6-phosphate isomerase-like protein (cupin superfamily)